MNDASYQTTPAGLRRLEERIRQAREMYDLVASSNADAAESGDNSVWHDNFAYEENQRQMHQWARTVRDLELLRAKLQIVPLPRAPLWVQLGCSVIVQDAESGEVTRWIIAGFDDGDPDRLRISYNSPLGRTLVGAEEGEIRTLRVNGMERELEILSIVSTPEEE